MKHNPLQISPCSLSSCSNQKETLKQAHMIKRLVKITWQAQWTCSKSLIKLHQWRSTNLSDCSLNETRRLVAVDCAVARMSRDGSLLYCNCVLSLLAFTFEHFEQDSLPVKPMNVIRRLVSLSFNELF
jgi:hypothetical protein